MLPRMYDETCRLHSIGTPKLTVQSVTTLKS